MDFQLFSLTWHAFVIQTINENQKSSFLQAKKNLYKILYSSIFLGTWEIYPKSINFLKSLQAILQTESFQPLKILWFSTIALFIIIENAFNDLKFSNLLKSQGLPITWNRYLDWLSHTNDKKCKDEICMDTRQKIFQLKLHYFQMD